MDEMIDTLRRQIFAIALLTALASSIAPAQVENVPISNPVYEFLDRLGVKGILPHYSNTMIPLSRREVADDLVKASAREERLTDAERAYLAKFRQEFAHEIDPTQENATALFRDGPADYLSNKEKYLYSFANSDVTAYVQLLGSLEYRTVDGDSYGNTHASLETIGGRVRGTVKNRLGYFLQGTNGALHGNREFALSDPRLRSNVKFNNLNSPYFDYTEAYLRADLSWFNIEFGREYNQIGTGYSDRLLLSDNAPVFDFIKLDAQYKSLRFVFLHGSLVSDSAIFPGLVQDEPAGVNKYLALHRLQVSLFDRLNAGVGEMIIYQRFSPEFGYLNPVVFYKSVEHSLRDRDNAFLSFDAELFPFDGYKLYGTWLIDDVDFSKLGTGWWGNEFGWQGGITAADVAGLADVDAVAEYTRIEPYVYSNRTSGDDYTNNNTSLGHHLAPNSDEWFLQLGWRPAPSLRAWLAYRYTRHGDNVVENGQVVRNVGGSALQGHRETDSETAEFLDGNRTRYDDVQLKASWEPIRSLYFTGIFEFRRTERLWESATNYDRYGAVKVEFGY